MHSQQVKVPVLSAVEESVQHRGRMSEGQYAQKKFYGVFYAT